MKLRWKLFCSYAKLYWLCASSMAIATWNGFPVEMWTIISRTFRTQRILNDLSNSFDLPAAEGRQLDRIGNMFGIIRRPGEDDESFRARTLVEAKYACYIYKDEAIAGKEYQSQSDAYGYAEIHHAKSDYDSLAQQLEEAKVVLSELRFELEAKQRPLSEQVLELTFQLTKEREITALLTEALKFYAELIPYAEKIGLGEPNVEMGLMPAKFGTRLTEALNRAKVMREGKK